MIFADSVEGLPTESAASSRESLYLPVGVGHTNASHDALSALNSSSIAVGGGKMSRGSTLRASWAASKSVDDLANSQRTATREQPGRHLPLDEIRRSVFRAWGGQIAKASVIPPAIDPNSTAMNSMADDSEPRPLKLIVPIPIASGAADGPPRKRELKVMFSPFVTEITVTTPSTANGFRSSTPPPPRSTGSGSHQGSPHVGKGTLTSPRKARREGSDRIPHDLCRVPDRRLTIDAFRITGQIVLPGVSPPELDEPIDDGLPEPMSFPVVLAVCDTRRNLELFPDGWAAIGLPNGPVEIPIVAEGESQPPFDPLLGVTDVILAACAAIMDL